MIVDEDEKNEEKNEKLLADLCECCLLLREGKFSELLSICVCCLLKVALNKEENEEAQKEREMALLALNNTGLIKIKKEIFLNEIKEIIEYRQSHLNLSRLAYQSAWQFLIFRFYNDISLEGVIVNELHFVGEATRELEELTRILYWKKKKGELRDKETIEEKIIKRWIQTLDYYFNKSKLQNEELTGLISSIVKVLRASRIINRIFCVWSISLLKGAAETEAVKINYLLKGGAVDAILEEIQQYTLEDYRMLYHLQFLRRILTILNKKKKNEMEEEERKATKIMIIKRMEEEGYADIIPSFHEIFVIIYYYYYGDISLDISDYFLFV
ncbi:uncharacterized protein MONOS_17861 [Monocercomonoides exilis]|uniref:uncharacterized protein n=1 Tax=Monocercomonoides exilis TaxID=2049356 RepID=UPI00355A63F7|nr:hypothetical protein MONOS_17861 [Monocercomonoides exilis]